MDNLIRDDKLWPLELNIFTWHSTMRKHNISSLCYEMTDFRILSIFYANIFWKCIRCNWEYLYITCYLELYENISKSRYWIYDTKLVFLCHTNHIHLRKQQRNVRTMDKMLISKEPPIHLQSSAVASLYSIQDYAFVDISI